MPDIYTQQTRLLKSSLEGYRWFSNLWNVASSGKYKQINIEITGFMDANLSAVLGGLVTRMRSELYLDVNLIRPIGKDGSLWNVLQKNGFLESLHIDSRTRDTYGTTIPYDRYEPRFENNFMKSILTLESKQILPAMSEELKREFRKNLLEVFSNASIHSQTKYGIHVCGQHFPRQHQIEFTICDMGVGIRQHVNAKMGTGFTAAQAIVWVMDGRNTTKIGGPIPGGIGLKLLREFISHNQGKLQIISDAAYWELSNVGTRVVELPDIFPGTIVNLEIKSNAIDHKHYRLAQQVTQ